MYDISARHHSQNCHPQPPSPTYLEDSGSNERHLPKKSQPNVVSHVQSRLHSADDYSGNSLDLISEHCVEMVIKYKDNGLELEAGFYPEHKRSMAMILFNDTQTFHSEIKKIAACIVPFKKATQLLESAQYLHGDPDPLGRTSNFTHPALKKICLTVYYCTSVKSLCQFVEFQASVPIKALTLVTAIICQFHYSLYISTNKHGVAKNETLCREEVEVAYDNLTCLIDQVWSDDYHGSKLDKMLRDWAKAGM
ncbi:hypothetical protein BKA83DRAFT_4128172 [Pisolithus microcarpus]|nr:hypothetical protein BKA83DRAFT_4128172 [Pisolithus microcarpus]